jgi:hypothetical protein
MSDRLDPTGPSQPTQQTGLNQAFNPVSKTSCESSTSKQSNPSQTIDHREEHDVPSTHSSDAQPSPLGSGDRGPLKERSIPASDAQNYSDSDKGDLEGEQMRAPGEGDVADAVREGGGGGHKGQGDFVGDMDRKKEEHEQELKNRGMRTS